MRYIFIISIISFTIFSTLFISPAFANSTIIDTHANLLNIDNIGQNAPNGVGGEQTFLVSQNAVAQQVRFNAKIGGGNPTTLFVYLKSIRAGVPLATASISGLTGTLTQYTLTFNNPVNLTANTTYRIEWACVGVCDNNNFFHISIDINNPYLSGAYYQYEGGSTWIDFGADANLQVLGTISGTYLTIGSASDIMGLAGALFSDFWIIIAIFIAVPLAFYIIYKIKKLFPKK